MRSRGKHQKAAKGGDTPQVRCAIYTRKSTDEGLDRDFNTLDAQREAAEAYITSQKDQGWVSLPDRYDDGGYTGGNLERPAMRKLLADIRDGKIDMVVVYKLDRLSRALLDFARLMDEFEAHDVRFASVTEQINSATPAGRMQVRMIMSFAEFERELIAERTRDKMRAARRKGKWVGGIPVLGYDIGPDGGGLAVNHEEAARVREIFALYLELGSMLPTLHEIRSRGWTQKRWSTKKGTERGGAPFAKGTLHRLLTSPVYIGKIKYENQFLAGEHEAILDASAWAKAQQLLKSNGRNHGSAIRNRNGALLKGLLWCASCGCRMIHSHTNKGSRRYRYYVCQKAQKNGWASCPTKSIPAPEIESWVLGQIRSIGQDRELQEQVIAQVRALRSGTRGRRRNGGSYPKLSVREIRQALTTFDQVWEALTIPERARAVQLLVERVEYDGESEKVSITFRPSGITALTQEGTE